MCEIVYYNHSVHHMGDLWTLQKIPSYSIKQVILDGFGLYAHKALFLINPCLAFRKYKIHLHILSFHNHKMAQEDEILLHGPLARYVILWVAHAPGMPGTFSPPARFNDPDMNHGTCVTHVPWCMSGSLTGDFLWSRWRGNVPGIPSACATRNFVYLLRGPWKTKSNAVFVDNLA